MGLATREIMAMRAAMEIQYRSIINLGIGIPTLVANYIPADKNVMIHGENGLLGIGADPEKGYEDPHIINAGGLPCTLVNGGSYFDSSISFAMIRSGMIDITFLGALEIAQNGDLANWIVPGKLVPGMGGGMELAQKAKKVIILTQHTNKKDESKIKKNCTLPITAKNCVNLIITDLGVMKIVDNRLILTEIFETTTIEEVAHKTEATLHIEETVKIIHLSEEGIYYGK
ncbi:MAG: 3-oxoacid CoA-transferase subunit B [Lachnotalea sp.]